MDRALADVNIAHLCDRPVETLSGGERQRTWIAMLLAQEPEVMLLDEPTTFLDIGCQYEILRLVRRLNREKGITTVMVLHDLNQLRAMPAASWCCATTVSLRTVRRPPS